MWPAVTTAATSGGRERASPSTRSTTSTACSCSTGPQSQRARPRWPSSGPGSWSPAFASPLNVAVAASAPFGADLLERLAARRPIAYLLTRPDRPRGRGRKVQPTAAKRIAVQLDIPVRQPERLDASFDAGARRRPDRRSGELRDHARRRCRHDLREERRPRRRAARAGAGATRVRAAARGGRYLRGEADRGGPGARLVATARRAPEPDPRALAAHRRPRRAARPAGHHLAGTPRRRPRGTARGAAGRGTAHDIRRVPPRPEMSVPRLRLSPEGETTVSPSDPLREWRREPPGPPREHAPSAA